MNEQFFRILPSIQELFFLFLSKMKSFAGDLKLYFTFNIYILNIFLHNNDNNNNDYQ